MHALNHIERRGRAKILVKIVGAEYDAAVNGPAALRNGLHGRHLHRRKRRPLPGAHGGESHCRKRPFQCAHGNGTQTVTLIDNLALLGQPQHSAHRAVGHGLDQVFGASSPACWGAAAAVKNQHLGSCDSRRLQELDLRHLQRPAGRRNPAFLIGV